MRKTKIMRIAVLSLLLLALVFINQSVLAESSKNDYDDTAGMVALSKKEEDIFAQNNLIGWDPTDCVNGGTISGNCGGEITATDLDERFRQLIEYYGIAAMNMQIEYGIPWEIPFIHMWVESHLGTDTSGIAPKIAACGYYNWMGYTYSPKSLYGIPESEMPCRVIQSDNNTLSSMYESVADMLGAFATDYLRNGNYDNAFQYATPENFDLEKFLREELRAYCDADNNAEGLNLYVSVFREKIPIIHEIAAEKGWPTSEELMRQKNIPKGGNWPVKGDIKDQMNVEPHSLHLECGDNASDIDADTDVDVDTDTDVETDVDTDEDSDSDNNNDDADDDTEEDDADSNDKSNLISSSNGSRVCRNSNCGATMGGVTTKEIGGITYAFPLAGAAKSNFLDNKPGRESVLSFPPTWFHHDYPAVDIGLRASLAGYEEKTAADYSDLSGSDMLFYSDGVPVVAFVSGTITSYKTYSNGVPANYVSKCASVTFKGDDGRSYWLGHMAFDDEIKQRVDSGDAHFEVGEKIGEIGPPPCAQSTQSHLHLQTSDKSDYIKTLINELYEALPETGSASTSYENSGNCDPTEIGEEGLTVEQAKQFMMNYGENRNNTSADAVGALWGMCNGGGSNCVTFSAFFLNKFTDTHVGTTPGNGNMVVQNLAGQVDTGTEPRVWAVFSAEPNHTGVILGHHDGNWIVGHASCSSSGKGKGDGTSSGGGSGFVTVGPNLDCSTLLNCRNVQYAYPEVNTNKIANYLSEGL